MNKRDVDDMEEKYAAEYSAFQAAHEADKAQLEKKHAEKMAELMKKCVQKPESGGIFGGSGHRDH